MLYPAPGCSYGHSVEKPFSGGNSAQKEITYLKGDQSGHGDAGTENNEIRHYQRIQSLGMMASHIAHEFNNYMTPLLIYAELLENDDSISAENQEMIHEITEAVDKASNLSKSCWHFPGRTPACAWSC